MAATRSISDLPGPGRLPLIGNAHQVRSANLHLRAKTALSMVARNFEIELDPAAEPVTELLGFTMSPHGLRVRLRECVPAIAGRVPAPRAS